MNNTFSDGMWPVMITPFARDGTIDYQALEQMIEWYIEGGSNGLFATCQSSEIFYLSLLERIEMTRFIKNQVRGRIPVIASGHISYSIEDQITELKAIADTGVDAVILISNRLVKEDEADDVLLENLQRVVNELPAELPLGFYECPYPYKRILSPKVVKYCVDSERFYFLKDTSCDIQNIKAKLALIEGSKMKLYNANTSTLLASLKAGASGYSGVMANFHPKLYAWLLANWKKEPEKAKTLQDILTMCSFIELKNYPLSSKYFLMEEGIPLDYGTRKNTKKSISTTEILELQQLRHLSEEILNRL